MTSSLDNTVKASGSQLVMRRPRYILPLLYRSTKTWITAFESFSSIVKRVRSQSQEAPNRLSWSKMIPPYLSFQSKACSKNASLPMSDFLIPCSLSNFTTLASVAIDAWSVPGTQHAFFPSNLALRIKIS